MVEGLPLEEGLGSVGFVKENFNSLGQRGELVTF